jgi:heptosyltransferase-2
MKPINFNNIKRLLIRSNNWIGDAVMTTPAVRAIRKNFPNARISILTKPWVAPVFSDSPYVDNLLIYDEAGKHKGLVGKMRLAKEKSRRCIKPDIT